MADSLHLLLYPELRCFAAPDRANALRHARRCALDAVELLGIAAGLIVVMLVVRYAIAFPQAPVTNAALGAALLAVAVAPFPMRRTRRMLRRMSERP